MACSSHHSLEQSQEAFSLLKSMPLVSRVQAYFSRVSRSKKRLPSFKIEKEASQYGISKIIQPVPPTSKKTAIGNPNRSLLVCAEANASSDLKPTPTFTTRQQRIGFCPKKPRPVQKPLWQSGEYYTFLDFEAKAKHFKRNYLKKYSKKGTLSTLEVETLFWKPTVDNPSMV
ncbi:hypothetical protein GOBAR_AA36502 [Gossypium barbadense]|uniref:Uncharacterized protein n=1 Tax=Gossypium barbadense TaxID=3634 RepID=A0A2P5VZI1_GOSBA|nr:hypothetical protein GOBAR_AA36502 [Gossypium barbadense]